MARIVLIEDDSAIRSSLTRDLTTAGHVVNASGSGAEGLSAALADRPDVVVLDLGLPDLDGRDVMMMLRAIRDVPVIVITARDDDASMVRLLDAGADDYVVKPFRATQLDARIRAVLRRTTSTQDPAERTIAVGRLVIDPGSREVTLDGANVDALPQGVRPGLGAGAPGRRGGVEARAARRGVAATVGRRRPHRGRPPLVVAAQAR